MFKGLFAQKQPANDAHALYGAVVARAREEQFFEHFSVPDTFDGRFEMMVMHLFLLHNRLKDEERAAREISQLVFDGFIDDMDRALREAGVGDPAIPKRIEKMMRVFYGRTGAYEDALSSDTPLEDLATVIGRNLYPDGDSVGREEPLANYMFKLAEHLSEMPTSRILSNKSVFGNPDELYSTLSLTTREAIS